MRNDILDQSEYLPEWPGEEPEDISIRVNYKNLMNKKNIHFKCKTGNHQDQIFGFFIDISNMRTELFEAEVSHQMYII